MNIDENSMPSELWNYLKLGHSLYAISVLYGFLALSAHAP
jgi:hypothetical protein